jgi:hypothetical protein
MTENKNKSGGAVVTMKVSALSIPVASELTLWLPGKDGSNHILKVYNDGSGVAKIETINTKIEVIE